MCLDANQIMSPARRKNMRAIRNGDTKPKVLLRKSLFARGYRYGITPSNISGSLNVWLSRFRSSIFINGCFWHAHDCSLFRLPKTQRDFLMKKLGMNIERDRKTLSQLSRQRFRILVVWECSFKKQTKITLPLTTSLRITWLESKVRYGNIT